MLLAGQREVETQDEQESTAPEVETVAVSRHDRGLDIDLDGVVVPYRVISLAAEVGGRVVFKDESCRAGNYVSKGTLLLRIDPRDYEFAVKQLEEELEQADVTLAELEVEAKNLKEMIELAADTLELQTAELRRQQRLAERRVATATQLDEARRAELQARNEVLSLRNQLQVLDTRRRRLQAAQELMRLRLDKARLDLERTRVTAPADGVVVADLVEADSYVNKGTQLVTLEDTSRVEVRCNMQVDELYWLWMQGYEGAAPDSRSAAPAGSATTSQAGGEMPTPMPGSATPLAYRDYQIPRTPATVIFELGGRRYAWEGVLSRYEGIGLDDRTRTVPVRVSVPNPRQVKLLKSGNRSAEESGASNGDRSTSVEQPAANGQGGTAHPALRVSGPPALVRGMYVSVRVHAKPNVPLFEVPEAAIRPGDRLWLVDGGRLHIARVRVVEVSDGEAVIRPDDADPITARLLQSGTQAIISPLAVAEEGMKVLERGNS